MPEPVKILITAKKHLKNDNSLITIQTGYHPEQFKKALFDYVYHEHYTYFTVKSLERIAEQCGLYIHKYEILDLRGGSLRMYLKKGESKKLKPNEGFSSLQEFKELEEHLCINRNNLEKHINDLKEKNYTIAGFGASHSTGILVHSFGLKEKIDYLIDENNSKIGHYMPGTSLKVHAVNKIKNETKVAVIILAHQYYDLIEKKLIQLYGNTLITIKPISDYGHRNAE